MWGRGPNSRLGMWTNYPNKIFWKYHFSSFDSTKVWTQGLVFVRQAVCHLSHTSGPFCFSYFFNRVSCFLPWLAWTMILLPMASFINGTHRTVPTHLAYWLRWSLTNVLSGLALKSNHLCLPYSWDLFVLYKDYFVYSESLGIPREF
jgi:hypothetical protein